MTAPRPLWSARIAANLTYHSQRLARPHLAGGTPADLYQEGVLAVLRGAARYDPTRAHDATYFHARVPGAMCDALDAATHCGHMHYVPWEEAPEPVTGPHEPDVFLLRRLRRAVNRLPRRLRTVVICRYWWGWTLRRVAQQLGVSESLVSRLERNALARLRETMG